MGSDKLCYDHALSVAQKNGWHFISLNAKDFAAYEKDFYTSSLDGAICVFYLSDAQLLTIPESEIFVKLIEDSPHRFMLGASEPVNWVLKKFGLATPLGSTESELTSSLKILLGEPDRDVARLALQSQDPKHLFHILKFGAWQHEPSLDEMIKISRNLYICHSDYILSMLAFALAPKTFATFHKKKEENPLQKSIKFKLEKSLPNYNKTEIADVYLLAGSAKFIPPYLDLSDEEKKFLGVLEQPEPKQPQAVFLKSVNLSDYL
jgi:hypothetical protein